MFLSIILQMGMREQPADFVTATWRTGAYTHGRIFRGGFADLLSKVKCEMSNESVATDPPVYVASVVYVVYHYDEVDRLFASLFAIRLTEIGLSISLAFELR